MLLSDFIDAACDSPTLNPGCPDKPESATRQLESARSALPTTWVDLVESGSRSFDCDNLPPSNPHFRDYVTSKSHFWE